jgi:hypothetical protein
VRLVSNQWSACTSHREFGHATPVSISLANPLIFEAPALHPCGERYSLWRSNAYEPIETALADGAIDVRTAALNSQRTECKNG